MIQRAKAFTLVELLVTIAIIALLASLLFPALSHAKASGRAAACRNNLRQVHLVLTMYLSEYSAYPPVMGVFGLSQPMLGFGELHPLVWWAALAAYSSLDNANWKIFSCPQPVSFHSPGLGLSQSDGTMNKAVPARDVFDTVTYGYNASGTAQYGTHSILGLGENLHSDLIIREQTVKSPSDMIAFGDGGPSSSLVISSASPEENPPARHNGKANLSFCDGHSEIKKPAQWIADTDAARCRWNNDFQPHR